MQLCNDDLTSSMVWLSRKHINCGTDLEARSGNEARVETHRSGQSVPSHLECATCMCFWTWRGVSWGIVAFVLLLVK